MTSFTFLICETLDKITRIINAPTIFANLFDLAAYALAWICNALTIVSIANFACLTRDTSTRIRDTLSIFSLFVSLALQATTSHDTLSVATEFASLTSNIVTRINFTFAHLTNFASGTSRSVAIAFG